VRDSKSISSTPRVRELARLIQETPGCVCEVIAIGNEAYNRLHHRMGTVNAILAWGHAQAIENLLRQKARMDPPPVKAISDQFAASKGTLARALKSLGRGIQLVQRHRAEEDLAVAAASILARNECLVRIAALEKKFGMSLPRGASASVDAAAEAFVGRYGAGELGQVAKLHFRNALVYRLLGDGAPARTASLSASAGGGPSEPDKNR
jgi:ribonuclease HIII